MAIAISTFGEFKGKRVDQFRLTSVTGVSVDIIGYGVAVRDWRVPVAGSERSVVLGFDSMDAYAQHSPHFGSLAGRVANRIKGASFDLNGKTYKLPANAGDLQLHGGEAGLGRQVWDGQADEGNNSVRFTHFSPDGAMGYPGNVNFSATYTLKGNRLRLELAATTDQATPISLVQHQYFNLGTTDDVLDHTIQVNSSAYTGLGDDLAPTGAILPSRGTIYDLRQPRTMRDENGAPVEYDMGVALDTGRSINEPVATVISPARDLTLKLWSDRPGLQVYNGVWTDIPVPGLDGKTYKKHAGFCLEDQAFADAVHNPHFPNVIYSPDRPYSHWCEFEIA
ncbi:aldose epimerase family protein [Devosia psychrophila]|jgi:aldose 1-epimerase|uniref:Aldose 1-epimerase n=1 Tax=Devosia psychrophila TaxID=728005 RepID=A0A0F5PSH8_9HYPH|nr:aldose epimerase family protein [Devosia psychrophila]KKC31540.1 aldose epimerase [Devosia psychrophila]SFB97198.1 aldose 1-epimerase [Devosia psychrophila]